MSTWRIAQIIFGADGGLSYRDIQLFTGVPDFLTEHQLRQLIQKSGMAPSEEGPDPWTNHVLGAVPEGYRPNNDRVVTTPYEAVTANTRVQMTARLDRDNYAYLRRLARARSGSMTEEFNQALRRDALADPFHLSGESQGERP